MPDRSFPPGPSTLEAVRGLRALGGANDLSSVPLFLSRVAHLYGPIASWRMLRWRFFLLDDPALIEDVLVTKNRDYKKGRGIDRLKRLLGDGLLTSAEPEHLRRRRLIAPAFHRERIDGYGSQMIAATQAHIGAWHDGATVEMDDEMTRLTLTIATQTLFSTTVYSDVDAIRSALVTAMRDFPASLSRLAELFDAIPWALPHTRRFAQARKRLDAVIYGIIAARRHGPAAEHDDLLEMLLAAADAQGGLDDVAVRDEAMTLFVAGHETTANALAWTWYLLARHPAVAERLRAELAAVLGEREPVPADFERLRFTRDVFAEALRLYPPAWILGRRAVRDTTIGTQFVPAGSVVLMSPLVTHANPRLWSDPGSFRPERWGEARRPAEKFAYFPFGGGNRRCIGESFAWLEGVLLIATVAQRFTVTPVDDTPVAVEPLVTLRPRSPVRLRLGLRRRPASAMIP